MKRDVCYVKREGKKEGETVICFKEDGNCKTCNIYKTEIEGKSIEELGKKFSYVFGMGKLNDKIRLPITDDGAATHHTGGGSHSEM